MQDIVKGSEERIHINIYNDGVLTQADNLPTVFLYDADNDTTPLTGFNNQVVDEDPTGVYSYLLTTLLTGTEKVLKVVWRYLVNGAVFNQEDFYRVSSVYASVSDIQDFLDLGNDGSQLNYKSPEKITSAEKIARTIIDGYTGQSFTKYSGSQEVFGKGADAVHVTEKMLTIEKVWENDVLVIDNTITPNFNTFGFALEPSPTGFSVRIINQNSNVRYDNQMDPTSTRFGRFRDNARYKFQGQIGYKYVPEDIKMAAMLLVGDILSNDYNWRNKYLSRVNLSEVSFQMAKGAFNGTGNVTVDNILDQYRNTNIVII